MPRALDAPFARCLSALADAPAPGPLVTDAKRAVDAGTLLAEAGAVARLLLESDPDGTSPVPVLVDRRVETVVGLVGVQLAGRASVALEATEPAERLAEIARRVGATAVVRAAPAGPDRVADIPVLDVGALAPVRVDPRPLARPDGLCAVVFTSGSTGRPKGVRVDADACRSMVERARIRRDRIDGTPTPAFAPFNYQAGLSTLAELATGWPAVLADPAEMDPVELLDWVDRERFAMVSLVPSYVRAALERWPRARTLDHLRVVTTYGEALQWSDVRAIRRLAPGAMVRVNYGASEAGGGICNFAIDVDDPLGTGPMPLGRPAAGQDVRLEPLAGADPATGPMEIVVRGRVAAGYWEDPELDAARFGVDPDGTRWWRSGDLATWSDGVLVHRGRVDDLVKIAGKLVEPAEAERALSELDGVVAASVLAQPLGAGHRLVAHVVPAAGARADDVRAALGRRLPAHLVPAVLVRHDELPVTVRGKVDRAALRAAPVRPWRDEPWVAPAGQEEWLVAGTVREVLALDADDAVGRHDDLLALGLDSLGAVELLAALADRGLDGLVADDLVAAPTVAGLVGRAVAGRRRSGVDASVVVLNADGGRPPIWAVPGAGATAFAFASLAAELGADQPVVVLEAAGLHDARRPARRIDEAAAVHLRELRRLRSTRFAATRRGPVLLAGHSSGGLVAHAMAAELARQGEDVRLVLLDTSVAFRPPHRRVRRIAGDLRRARVAPPPDVELDLPEGWWEAADLLRRQRTLVDAVRGRPLARSAVAGDGNVGRLDAEHYQRHFLDGMRQAEAYRPAAAPGADLLVVGRRSGAELSWYPVAPPAKVVRVEAGHNALLHPPIAAEVAAAVMAVVEG